MGMGALVRSHVRVGRTELALVAKAPAMLNDGGPARTKFKQLAGVSVNRIAGIRPPALQEIAARQRLG
jgi:hypothetical protein